MDTTETDMAEEFALCLLRAGSTVSRIAGDLIEELDPDTFPGEDHGVVIVDMVIGSICCSLQGVDDDTIVRATELIAEACDRVVTDLRLAVELQQRQLADGDSDRRCYG